VVAVLAVLGRRVDGHRHPVAAVSVLQGIRTEAARSARLTGVLIDN
jgi:hypothetical protein